jgi:hypothetical protein
MRNCGCRVSAKMFFDDFDEIFSLFLKPGLLKAEKWMINFHRIAFRENDYDFIGIEFWRKV